MTTSAKDCKLSLGLGETTARAQRLLGTVKGLLWAILPQIRIVIPHTFYYIGTLDPLEGSKMRKAKTTPQTGQKLVAWS